MQRSDVVGSNIVAETSIGSRRIWRQNTDWDIVELKENRDDNQVRHLMNVGWKIESDSLKKMPRMIRIS